MQIMCLLHQYHQGEIFIIQIKTLGYLPIKTTFIVLFVCLFEMMLSVPVNSSGHVEMLAMGIKLGCYDIQKKCFKYN